MNGKIYSLDKGCGAPFDAGSIDLIITYILLLLILHINVFCMIFNDYADAAAVIASERFGFIGQTLLYEYYGYTSIFYFKPGLSPNRLSLKPYKDMRPFSHYRNLDRRASTVWYLLIFVFSSVFCFCFF